MKIDDLVEELARFNFGEEEARLFYHLSRRGPSQASDVAQAAGIQRTKVYRLLDELVARGAVERTLERPQRFVARPLEEVLGLLLDERRQELEGLSQTVPELAQAWPTHGVDEATQEVRFTVLEGRAQIQGLMERAVAEAQDEVFIVSLKRGLARLEHLGLLDVLADRVEEGVIARVLTEVSEPNLATARRWAKTCEVRHTSLPGYHQALMVDNRRIILFVAVDPLVSTMDQHEETVLALNAPDFILSQKALADLMWDTALDLEDREAELETGRVAPQVQVVRGRWTRYNKKKDMLYRAKDEVRMVMSSEEAARMERAGLAHLLSRRAEAGLSIRVLVTGDQAPDIDGVTFRLGAAEGLPPALLLVDDDEVLSLASSEGAPESITHPQDWATWATVDEEVARLARGFEEAWKRAKEPG